MIIRTLLTIAGLVLATQSFAASVTVHDAHARATFPMAQSGAVYLALTNTSDKPVTVTGVTVDAAVADDAQIHTTDMQGDVMQMREVTDGVTLAPGQKVAFAPGGYHIMLLGLKNGLDEGNSVDLTLQLTSGETVDVTAAIKAIDKQTGHHHHH
ncbi:copper chaperone PCu(A)C [Alteromonas sp. ASW11-19]|uniref:Copper chaperone PCu(A)C n=1 Tax=Alteromonas salexigens TaxID=2982530 RepID=A0ABT2VLU7_9ALTE|nr:copper chaperone PCu(A)C [Alteromonas salexigens]MCU7553241.1 copper chaperone PCu(A)C [Alteromonas salexigens]